MERRRKKTYSLNFVRVGTQEQSDEIIRSLAKSQIEKVLEKHGAVSYDLDKVLNKYISEDMCNEYKEE